ncbi:MAG: hypothetical protein AB1705_24305 [Verrucomicrobiota bacterium]
MKTCILCIALGTLLFIGCTPEPTKPAAPSAEAKSAPVPLGVAPEASAPPPVPGAPAAQPAQAASETPTEEPDPGDGSVTSYNPDPGLMELQPVVDQYMSDTLRNPKSFDEIIKAGFLRQVPPAPKGKKYVIDQETFTVKLVNL